MSIEAATDELVVEELREDGTLLRLALDQPPGNVLTLAMMRALGRRLDQHRSASGLRLIMLCGAGAHFSYGASVEEHQREHAAELLATFHGLLRQVFTYPVPIAAVVDGSCLGGAFELVLGCHFVFAASAARFACPEIKLGVFPPVLAALGAARLGGPLAERLLLTGAMLDAAEAERYGLLTAPAVAGDVEASVTAWYRRTLRPLSAFALRQATAAVRCASGRAEAFDRALGAAERQYLDQVIPSHDGNEGIAAFLAKRTPVWSDR